MTNQELQVWVEKISLADFGRPFLHRAFFNHRLRTTGGRFNLNDLTLEFNPSLFSVITSDQKLGVVRHELVHYHLYRAHRGYMHRDADFKVLLAEVGGLRFAPSTKQQFLDFVYVCTRCGERYLRRRRIDTNRYVCGRCGGKLSFLNVSRI